MTLTFTLDGFHNRLPNGWRTRARSYMANQRVHAREHGYAGAWRADGSFQLFYLDEGRLRSRTWPSAKPVTRFCGHCGNGKPCDCGVENA